MATKQIPVWFNQDHKKIYDTLVKLQLTSKPFHEFVKSAFYSSVDKLNIEKITQNKIMELTPSP